MAENPLQRRLSKLSRARSHSYRFGSKMLPQEELAKELGLLALSKTSFEGVLSPDRENSWRLSGKLFARIVQECVISAEPVISLIEAEVSRVYVSTGLPEQKGETPMPEDTDIEPLPELLDFRALIAEALSLEIPDYPRAEGVALPPGLEGEDEVASPRQSPFSALKKMLPPEE